MRLAMVELGLSARGNWMAVIRLAGDLRVVLIVLMLCCALCEAIGLANTRMLLRSSNTKCYIKA